jgi:hypothetical protein
MDGWRVGGVGGGAGDDRADTHAYACTYARIGETHIYRWMDGRAAGGVYVKSGVNVPRAPPSLSFFLCVCLCAFRVRTRFLSVFVG